MNDESKRINTDWINGATGVQTTAKVMADQEKQESCARTPLPFSRMDRIRHGLAMHSSEVSEYHRAMTILERHPEFEEFLELQRFLNTHVEFLG